MLARDPNYTGMEFKMSDVTGKMEAVEKQPWLKYLRIGGSVCVILVFIVLVYITVMFAMWVKLDPDSKSASQIGSLIVSSSTKDRQEPHFSRVFSHFLRFEQRSV